MPPANEKPSSTPATDGPMQPSPSCPQLLERLLELYWSFDAYGISDERRMRAVLIELSNVIRTWAPDPGQARICYLAINEIADRLVRECDPK